MVFFLYIYSIHLAFRFFKVLDKEDITYNESGAKWFFHLIHASFIIGFALSVLWCKPPLWIYLIGAISVVIQLLALAQFIGLLKCMSTAVWKRQNYWIKLLLLVSLCSFTAKTGLQALSAIPYFANLAHIIKDFIIGYLHLVFLGFVSPFILAFFIHQKTIVITRSIGKAGLSVFLLGCFLVRKHHLKT